VPAVNVRLQNDASIPLMLSVRRICAENGVATPFYQILSWLSNKKDYFTAASIALDLLRDAGTLGRLWRSFDRIDEDDERTRLEGLLDGILPIQDDNINNSNVDSNIPSTIMQLADMTVGCLTRGGFPMSSTLEYFVQQDHNYDVGRTCLVLAAATAQAISGDEAEVSVMGDGYEPPEDQVERIQDILWPVRCLLQVGVSRNKLMHALALINAAIPDELRRKKHHNSVDSMELCKALVKLIIRSSKDAISLLLDIVDEHERKRFWYSLDHDTQLELALVFIANDGTGECPFLLQLEVRSWAMHYLQTCLQEVASSGGRGLAEVPTEWLKNLCSACLVNARCDLSGLLVRPDDEAKTESRDDGLTEHARDLTVTREALIAGHNSGSLDYNLLVPALLLLNIRDSKWCDDSWVSTQSILNAACNLAGRVTAEEPLFAFDSSTLMRECFLAENISAGANLVGGKNGLILECCSILMDCSGMSMEDAEHFLTQDTMKSQSTDNGSSETEKVADEFVLGYGHQQVLWLLDQHLLQVKTYGEFDSPPARGKVDPVFAARVCLRTWYSITRAHLSSASGWLAMWLRQQLGIDDERVSNKRLPCSALSRVLLWHAGSKDEGVVLAEQLELETRFLVQLSQACWSLVEAVPPSFADELLQQDAADGPNLKRPTTSDSYVSRK